MRVGMSCQGVEKKQKGEGYQQELYKSDLTPVQMWKKSEPLALDFRVKSPIFWSVEQITKGIGCRGGRETALRQLSVCRDRLSPPSTVLCPPPQRRLARWLQTPGTRLLAPSALYTAWKGANMPLSA